MRPRLIPEDVARDRGLGVFRGIALLAIPVAAAWTPIAWLLFHRAF